MYKLLKEASLLTLVALLLSACGGSLNEGNTDVAIDGPPPSREWQLVWSDEFEGSVLNPDYWNIQIGDGRAYGLTKWGNGEAQYYTDSPDNIRVEDGNMVITSLGDGVPMSEVDPVYGNPNTDYPFTSARVTTSQKIEFTYGRVEANIKIASTEGLWQAFWLLGSES
ncbi:MAG: glycoside hydrolase family 16 protein, partial [Cellvibrionales bacterium]|nr:glycoside hydrolase family 16 protein [Cellvibrionales bacterium]